MTLAQIVERLERIEQIPVTIWNERHSSLMENRDVKDEIRALKLDIEMALIKAGQL